MKPIEVLTAFLHAYQCKDIDTIASMLAENVKLKDWNLTAHGKAAVLADTQKNFNDAISIQIDVRKFFEGEHCAAARLRIVVNETVELEVVDTIEIDLDGKICCIRAYKG